MNPAPIVQAIDNLTSGNITEQDITALAGVFREYQSDDSAPITVISDGCQKGLRHAVRELRWKRYINQAVALLDTGTSTNHSLAKVLASELDRFQRGHRPRTPLQEILANALAVHPGAGISIAALWNLADTARRNK